MPKFIVEGGIPLNGNIRPAGNKNAALPIIAATLLTDQPVTLENVPDIKRRAHAPRPAGPARRVGATGRARTRFACTRRK